MAGRVKGSRFRVKRLGDKVHDLGFSMLRV